MIKKRDVSLDIISGILIILIILYHAAQWAKLSDTEIYKNALNFFYFLMPWFYFKSGYVHNDSYSFRKMFKVSLSPLIFLLVIGTLIGYIFTLPGLIRSGESIFVIIAKPFLYLIKSGMTLGNPPLWFLLSLFFVKVIISFIVKLSYKLIGLSIIAFVCVGWAQSFYFPNLNLGAHQALPLGISFSLLGYLYRKKKVITKISNYKIPVILVTLLSSIFMTSYVHVHFNELRYGSYWIYFINCVLAISSILIIFKYITWKPLIWIGQRTFIFFIVHWPLFFIIYQICRLLDVSRSGWIFMYILSIFATLGSIIIAYYFPHKYLISASSRIVELGKIKLKKTPIAKFFYKANPTKSENRINEN
ncbi:acyltransferase family protein [Winogradskyella ursingii]|uniref:acyltransferase family protein n=1 Tax=Winogradskyella ursingii TaxID=2686079 RepID=UPI0015C9F83F|nr:acyltransferase family protein [Winogradskyella ursingii]